MFKHAPFKVCLDEFCIELPEDWEVSGYIFDPEEGRLNFASQQGALGGVRWRLVKRFPDMERTIIEVNRRLVAEEKGIDRDDVKPEDNLLTFETLPNGAVLGYGEKGKPFFGGSLLEKSGIFFEWSFSCLDGRMLNLARSLMKSFRANEPDERGFKFYAMFGLELKLPKEYLLSDVNPYPAAVTLSFETLTHKRIIAHRWGMANCLLENCSVLDFYHRFLFDSRYSIRAKREFEILGESGGEVEFRTRGRWGFDFLLGAWWRGRGEVVLSPDENRIYAIEFIAKRSKVEPYGLTDCLANRVSLRSNCVVNASEEGTK